MSDKVRPMRTERALPSILPLIIMAAIQHDPASFWFCRFLATTKPVPAPAPNATTFETLFFPAPALSAAMLEPGRSSHETLFYPSLGSRRRDVPTWLVLTSTCYVYALSLTNLLPRPPPQALPSYYDGNLVFFADAQGAGSRGAPASRLDFISAYVSLCKDTLHFAGEPLALESAHEFPTTMPSETMIRVAAASHCVLPLPRSIFADCDYRHPDMDYAGPTRATFDPNKLGTVSISLPGARTLDALVGLANTPQAIQLRVPSSAPAAGGAPLTPAQRLAQQASAADSPNHSPGSDRRRWYR